MNSINTTKDQYFNNLILPPGLDNRRFGFTISDENNTVYNCSS